MVVPKSEFSFDGVLLKIHTFSEKLDAFFHMVLLVLVDLLEVGFHKSGGEGRETDSGF